MTISFSCLETAYEVFIIVEVMIKQLNVNLSETMGTTCSKRVKSIGSLKKGANIPLWCND